MCVFVVMTESELGIEKSLYYWEQDSCTVNVCVKMNKNSVPGGDDGYAHILSFRVYSEGM